MKGIIYFLIVVNFVFNWGCELFKEKKFLIFFKSYWFERNLDVIRVIKVF